ncbi:hypothetical protein EYF80_010622 [Liparis tanakae]|uniref:Uncharacterized protein n=1 Tax=Liparis tanakae TaxID=230148 RepID=A0A4Z2INZ2_9TELE|nr:hypothetical protein EYF80_010622 [Liparis tanakae]
MSHHEGQQEKEMRKSVACNTASIGRKMMVGGGELTTSQTMSASSPSLNSCGVGALWKPDEPPSPEKSKAMTGEKPGMLPQELRPAVSIVLS